MADHATTALGLLRAHLVAAVSIIDGLIGVPPTEGDGPELACPHCGERREAKLEETTAADEGGNLTPRVTCLTCGKSFNPTGEEGPGNG